MPRYHEVVYEIWGNKKDGFWVNNAWKTGNIIKLTDKELETDASTIKALKEQGVLKKGIHEASVDIDGEPDYTLYVNDVRQMVGGFCPAFELINTEV